MPATGEPADRVLKSLHEAGSPATMATMGGRFFGGVIGGSLPITVAAHWLADAWDQNACLFEISPISSYLEEIVLTWLLDLFDLPKSAGGADAIRWRQKIDRGHVLAGRGRLTVGSQLCVSRLARPGLERVNAWLGQIARC